MSARHSLARFFVAPAPTGTASDVPVPGTDHARRPAPTGPASSYVGVIAPEEDVAAVAGGIAGTLRRGARTRTAIVCRPAHEGARAPSTPATHALARRLTARDLPATPAGRVCHVELPADPVAAASALDRVAGLADVPVLLAMPGRLEGFDGLLARADRLVLATSPVTDPELSALALASLGALGPDVACAAAPQTALAKRAAALGFTALSLTGVEPADAVPPDLAVDRGWTPPAAPRLDSCRAQAPT